MFEVYNFQFISHIVQQLKIEIRDSINLEQWNPNLSVKVFGISYCHTIYLQSLRTKFLKGSIYGVPIKIDTRGATLTDKLLRIISRLEFLTH